MNILYICTYYHRAMIFYDSMNALRKTGIDIKAFNAVAKGTHIDSKYRGIMDNHVIHAECFSKWDKYVFFYKQRKIYNSICYRVNLDKYDMIHSHALFTGGYVAYKLKKKFGIPYIVSVRNTDINFFLKIPFFKKIAIQVIKEASGIQFLSVPYKHEFERRYIKKEHKKDFREKSIVIRNGLESFWIDNCGMPKTIHPNVINALYVGKIDSNKNLYATAFALESLKNRGYQVRFTVVGQILDQKIASMLKQSEITQVLPYTNKEELLKIYRKNDIFIMPSITETFGRVYAEAMSQGLPVIYSKGQGFDGIFEDGTIGYAVPCHDTAYITECLIKIINDYEKMSRRCIENIDIFNWNTIAQEVKSFYIKSVRDEGKVT